MAVGDKSNFYVITSRQCGVYNYARGRYFALGYALRSYF